MVWVLVRSVSSGTSPSDRISTECDVYLNKNDAYYDSCREADEYEKLVSRCHPGDSVVQTANLDGDSRRVVRSGDSGTVIEMSQWDIHEKEL